MAALSGPTLGLPAVEGAHPGEHGLHGERREGVHEAQDDGVAVLVDEQGVVAPVLLGVLPFERRPAPEGAAQRVRQPGKRSP